jgi:hypothetical protein
MDEPVKRRDPSAFPSNIGDRKESPKAEPSSAATPIPIELSRNAHESETNECTLHARLKRLADELMSDVTGRANVAANQRGPTEKEIKTLQSKHATSMVDEITSDGLVRLLRKKHLAHIACLEKLEKQSNKPHKDWAPNMQVLNSLVAILQKIEAVQKLIDARVQTRIPIPQPQLSEKAQKIAELSTLDRQLLIEVGEKTRILLKRRIEERRAARYID